VDTGQYDLLIIGGGINGAGIARDAPDGPESAVVEQNDLASATSSLDQADPRRASLPGVLRFRLVAEALAERERCSGSPALVWPMESCCRTNRTCGPLDDPRGLFLYDHLGHRMFASEAIARCRRRRA